MKPQGNNIQKGWLPLEKVVDLCLIDDYDDTQALRQRYRNWVLRGYKKLRMNLLRRSQSVLLPVSNMGTAALPENYEDWMMVGYVDGCGEVVPMQLQHRPAVEAAPACGCTCPSDHALCDALRYELLEESVVIEGEVYTKTTKIAINQKTGAVTKEITEPIPRLGESSGEAHYVFVGPPPPQTFVELQTSAGINFPLQGTFTGDNAAEITQMLNATGAGTFAVSVVDRQVRVETYYNPHRFTALLLATPGSTTYKMQGFVYAPPKYRYVISLPYSSGMMVMGIMVGGTESVSIYTAVTGGNVGPLAAVLLQKGHQIGAWTVYLMDGDTLVLQSEDNPHRLTSLMYRTAAGDTVNYTVEAELLTEIMRFNRLELGETSYALDAVFTGGDVAPLQAALNALGVGSWQLLWSDQLHVYLTGAPYAPWVTLVWRNETTQMNGAADLFTTEEEVVEGGAPVAMAMVRQAIRLPMHTRVEESCTVTLQPCGCVAHTEANLRALVATGHPAAYCACPSICTAEGFSIHEEEGFIQVGEGIRQLYLRYQTSLPCVNGRMYVPEVAAETLVAYALYKRDQRRKVSATQKNMAYQQYLAERRELRKNILRIRPQLIRAALNLIPY